MKYQVIYIPNEKKFYIQFKKKWHRWKKVMLGNWHWVDYADIHGYDQDTHYFSSIEEAREFMKIFKENLSLDEFLRPARYMVVWKGKT